MDFFIRFNIIQQKIKKPCFLNLFHIKLPFKFICMVIRLKLDENSAKARINSNTH